MDKLKYEKIGEANSRAEADVIKSFLEAEGIDVELVEESMLPSAYGYSTGQVDIFVPKEQVEQARKLLESFDDILPGKDEDDEEE